MTHEEFHELLSLRLGMTSKVLAAKSAEYSTNDDKLHNFKQAALLQRCTPAQALLGMVSKQLVSIVDMVKSEGDYPTALWDEKIGDAINYLILLEAIVKEK